MKKLTLKEEFLKRFPSTHNEDVSCTEGYPEDIFAFFEPYLKKQKSPALVIDEHLVKTFNEFWPKEKLPTGKHGRCSMSELMSSFQWFFKVHPTFTDWRILLEAADTYTRERSIDNWNYTKRSKYFIRKQLSDKSWCSDLSEYYERIRDGVQDEPENKQGFFDVKIY